MENILNEIIEKLQCLKLINIEIEYAKKITSICINSVKNYILCEINNNIDFLQIKEIFIDIVIGEYLTLIKNANLDENMEFETAIKSISEGDVSITYFENKNSKDNKLNFLIQYFLNKKSLLLNFKAIRWWFFISIFRQNINHIKKLFNGCCDIYEYTNFKDEETKITTNKLNIKYENVLCRVSYYKNISKTASLKNDFYNNKIKQDVKLILQNDIKINAGSIIIVRQNGKETKYKNSSEPILYSAHQELILEIFEETA